MTTDQHTSRVLATDVLTMPLSAPSQPGTWIDGGWPTARVETLDVAARSTTAVWEVTEGVVADVENDEVVLILAGSGRLAFEGGDTVDLAPGVALRLRAGDRTEWTVLSTIRALTITQR